MVRNVPPWRTTGMKLQWVWLTHNSCPPNCKDNPCSNTNNNINNNNRTYRLVVITVMRVRYNSQKQHPPLRWLANRVRHSGTHRTPKRVQPHSLSMPSCTRYWPVGITTSRPLQIKCMIVWVYTPSHPRCEPISMWHSPWACKVRWRRLRVWCDIYVTTTVRTCRFTALTPCCSVIGSVKHLTSVINFDNSWWTFADHDRPYSRHSCTCVVSLITRTRRWVHRCSTLVTWTWWRRRKYQSYWLSSMNWAFPAPTSRCPYTTRSKMHCVSFPSTNHASMSGVGRWSSLTLSSSVGVRVESTIWI